MYRCFCGCVSVLLRFFIFFFLRMQVSCFKGIWKKQFFQKMLDQAASKHSVLRILVRFRLKIFNSKNNQTFQNLSSSNDSYLGKTKRKAGVREVNERIKSRSGQMHLYFPWTVQEVWPAPALK